MSTEPVAIGAAVNGVIVAILALLVGTETVTPEVGGYLLGIATAVIVLVASIVRSKVTPDASA